MYTNMCPEGKGELLLVVNPKLKLVNKLDLKKIQIKGSDNFICQLNAFFVIKT